MSRKVSSLEHLVEDISFYQYNQNHSTNQKEIQRMKEYVSKAINNELTKKQRYCLCEHYLKKRKVIDIAKELSVSQPAVTRCIQRAVEKIKDKTIYYF